MPIPLGVLAVAGAGAAGGGGSFDLLETTLISSNTASVTFSNLNNYSAYKHLQIRQAIGATSGTNYNLQFNGDTGSNYAFHVLYGTGSTVAGLASTSQTWIRGRMSNESSSSIFSGSIVDILDFSNSSKNTTTRHFDNGAGLIWFGSGLWNNTAAVTSITIAQSSTGFEAGSRISLYGIK